MTEDELLRLGFVQIGRLFKAYELKDNEQWRKFRLIAYETWRKGAKNALGIDAYMPVGKEELKELSKDELDQVWRQYGKLDRKKKRVKLFKRRNVKPRA